MDQTFINSRPKQGSGAKSTQAVPAAAEGLASKGEGGLSFKIEAAFIMDETKIDINGIKGQIHLESDASEDNSSTKKPSIFNNNI